MTARLEQSANRLFGAGNEARTRDLNLGKVALYQLSYTRICTSNSGGAIQSRTGLTGFAIRGITALLSRRLNLKSVAGEPTKKEAEASTNKPGAGNEARTRDLNLGKVALYQLSYSRISLSAGVRGAW